MIDFYFDFISPYGYLAATKIDALAAGYGRTVRWHPFLLGVTVLKIMGGRPLMEVPLKSDYLRHDKPRLARLFGVPLVERDMKGVDSLRASRAHLWLAERDAALAHRFARAIFTRLFVRGEDITALADVQAEAAALGVDAEQLAAEIESPKGKDRLRAAVDAAVARGVFGAPTFIVDGEPIWGADRLWMLEHWLKFRSWDPDPRRSA